MASMEEILGKNCLKYPAWTDTPGTSHWAGGRNPHLAQGRHCTGLILLYFLEKSYFLNCAIVKASWCSKNILDKSGLQMFLLNSLHASCLCSPCLCHLLPAWALGSRPMVSCEFLDSRSEGPEGASLDPSWNNDKAASTSHFFPDTLRVWHSNGIFLTLSAVEISSQSPKFCPPNAIFSRSCKKWTIVIEQSSCSPA